MPGQSRFFPAVVSALSLLPSSDAFMLRPPTAASCKRSSPALHASFTVGSGGTPTSSSDKPCDDGSADGPILRPTGTHHPADSMAPLAEAARWSKREGSYFNELIEANGGASVFKAHPGLAFTFLTDSASTEWFFSQPQSVLDRQDGRYFGPHECTEAYIGVSTPPLIANQDESHLVLREYAIEAFRTRVPFGQSAMTHATDAFYEKLWKEGMGEHSLIYNFFLEPMSHFMHEWIFGMGVDGGPPLPPFKDFLNVNPLDLSVLLEIDPDTPAANAAAKAALANRKPSAEVLASVESILDAIRASKVWAGFMDMAKERNVDTTDMEHSFMFSTNFQSAVAVAKNMMPVIAALTLDPDFLKDLRNEIDGKDLTFDSVRDPEGFPLLDSFYWETLRLFPLPAFTVKKVVSDAVVPTSSGKKYQVKKGELLCVEPALGQMDPTVFGPDARDFNPRRFVGNPELKHKVFAYGYIDHDKVEGTQWGCAAHAIGMVDGICKIFYGRWVQEAEWELTSTPVLSADAFVAEVGPRDMSFAKITPRKK